MSNIRDVVIEGRMSSLDLALCAKYLVSIGMMPRSNSDLLNLCVQVAAYATKLEPFDTVADARKYLEGMGLGKLNRAGRGRNIANRAMQEETLIADGFDPSYGVKKRTKAISDEEFKKMVEQALKNSEGGDTGA